MKIRNVLPVVVLLIAVMIFSGFSTSERHENARKIIRKYKKEEGFIGMSIPTSLIRIFIPKEETEVKEFLKDIRKIRFLVYDDPSGSGIVKSCKKDMDALFKNKGYIELLTVIDDSETVKIRAIPDGDNLKDMVIFVNSTDELVIVNFVGSVDLHKMMSFVENKKNSKSPHSMFKI